MRTNDIVRFASDVGAIARRSSPATAAEYVGRAVQCRKQVARSGNLSSVDHSMSRRTYTWHVQGVRVELPGKLFAGAREMYARQVYFQEGFELRSDDVVFDLGANQGLFTLLAALRCTRVISVEAQPTFVADARKLLSSHGVLEKVAFEAALVGGGIGVLSETNEFLGGRPEETSMEELIRKHDVTRIGLMKCDIEGSEFEVFSPNKDEWLDIVDRISMEVHTRFGDHQALESHLTHRGFKVTSLDSRLKPLIYPVKDAATYLFASR